MTSAACTSLTRHVIGTLIAGGAHTGHKAEFYMPGLTASCQTSQLATTKLVMCRWTTSCVEGLETTSTTRARDASGNILDIIQYTE